MSNKQQTAVDWLVEQLPLIQQEGLRDIIEQAKELEKQQKQKYLMAILDCKNLLKEINKTATVGQTQINIKIFELENILNAEQYYNETYKTKKP